MARTANETLTPADTYAATGWAGYLLGFALGGFFDGILLHQILQWHHLLSGLEGEAFRDVRLQILADGLFHVLMYIVLAIGLAMLWRARSQLPRAGADRLLVANALIGFGVWHALDGVLSHWVLGIHRIRMDSDSPLFWDLLWFFAFGVLFLALGWVLRRRPPRLRGSNAGDARGTISALLLSAGAVLSGWAAALPPPNVSTVMVVFEPGTSTRQMFEAFAAVNGGIVWADPTGSLWALHLADAGRAVELYRHGALLVSSSSVAMGCLAWTRTER